MCGVGYDAEDISFDKYAPTKVNENKRKSLKLHPREDKGNPDI